MVPVPPFAIDKSRWLTPRGPFPLIAGPCSLESPGQIRAAARSLAALGVDVLRAGIWKARTRPGGFEGLGASGLRSLKEAGAEVGLPVACEVALPAHVEACLDAGIDVLWLGTRTTVNPIAVQALADALGGVDIPLLVKNPICPELDLWLGALERLGEAGIRRLAAVHRGFSVHGETGYRYQPLWPLPAELRRRWPGLPIFCDPSHIAGARGLVQEVALEALSAGLDGLMVEVHPDPGAALSDAAQQLSPAELEELVARHRHARSSARPSPTAVEPGQPAGDLEAPPALGGPPVK